MTHPDHSLNEILFPSSKQMEGADNYNDWTFDLLKRYLRGSVLEVGCGVGSFTRRILTHQDSTNLLSIDISQAAVEHCRQAISHPGLELRCVNVDEVAGKFDAIICMNVLEHIEDDAATLTHLLEILNPDGVLFLLVPAHPFLFSLFDELNGHYRRYDKRMIRDLLQRIAAPHEFRELFYFNIIGALGYWFVYKVLRKKPDPNGMTEIDLFDRIIVPVARRLEGKWAPFGLSLVAVLKKAA